MKRLHTTPEILAELRRALGCTNYRVAKLLGTSSSVTTAWETGRNRMSQEFALKAAKLLEWDPAYLVACIEHEAAESTLTGGEIDEAHRQAAVELASVWERIAQQFRAVVPSILLAALVIGSLPKSARASENLDSGSLASSGTIYTLCVLRSRAIGWLARWLLPLAAASVASATRSLIGA